MIKKITFEQIFEVWQNHLWPNRTSPIESNSAMIFLGGYTMDNMHTTPTFLGYYVEDKLVGVNSGHKCSDNSYRSRGLFVFPEFRHSGIATTILKETIKQGEIEGCSFVWSYPRKTSWRAYEQANFVLMSDWEGSETSEANAYCGIYI
jgi:GNAT superfamily N-acetyltransferase